jgi:hypothetical protein
MPRPAGPEEFSEQEITYLSPLAIAKVSWTLANLLYPVMSLRSVKTVVGIRGDGLALSNPLARTLSWAYGDPRRKTVISSSYCRQTSERNLQIFDSQGIFLKDAGETVIVMAYAKQDIAQHVAQLARSIRDCGGIPRAVVSIFNHGIGLCGAQDLLGVPNFYYISLVKD